MGIPLILDGLEQVADAEFVVGEDAFDERAAGAGSAGDEDLAVEAGGCGFDVRDLRELRHEWSPVADAVAGDLHQLDVGG